MAVLKCKMCGGSLEIQDGKNIAECPYCMTKQTVPVSDSKLEWLYNRANQYRLDNEFDKAYSAYESIVSEKNDEAEAYWGMVLSEFGIEYVEDPESKKRVPTCHRTLTKPIAVNENYKSALNFADIESRALYEDEAEIIDTLQKKVLNASAKEDPYDVFICYKETAADGNRTPDSVLAQEIYEHLNSRGLRVFFSRITLEDKLGKDYEPCIYAALTSSRVMLVVTTDTENCNSVWVKNEWKRYLDFMKTDSDKVLIPVYKDMSPYALPDEFAKLQAQDMSKLGAIQDLARGVEKLVGKKNREEKSGLSDAEKKLLGELEKKQERNKKLFDLSKVLLKLGICLLAGAAVMAVFYSAVYSFAPTALELPLLDGLMERSLFSYIVRSMFFALSILYVATLVSVIFFKKKAIKYMQYSFVLLFAVFSVWLMIEASGFYSPTTLLWTGFAAVGVTAVLSVLVHSIVNRKLPVLLVVMAAVFGALMLFESRIPEKSCEPDSSVRQIVITTDYINLREGPDMYSRKIGVVEKDELYTVLETVEDYDYDWFKIKTGYGTEGYIVAGEGKLVYYKEFKAE